METRLDTGAHASACWRAQGAVASPSHTLLVPRLSLCCCYRVTAETVNDGVLKGCAPDSDLSSAQTEKL